MCPIYKSNGIGKNDIDIDDTDNHDIDNNDTDNNNYEEYPLYSLPASMWSKMYMAITFVSPI